MRLLDHVAQCSVPFVVRQASGDVWQLSGCSDYAEEVARCPLRYVVTDDLLRACVDLAYSEGAGLSACLDLVHIPAEQVWIEWSGRVQRDAIVRLLPECANTQHFDGLHRGVLISADSAGRAGSVRTFWLPSTASAEPLMAALETHLDLNGDLDVYRAESLLEGVAVEVRDPCNAQIDKLLRCAGFRLIDAWLRYYAAVARTAAQREEVIRRSLATVAFDPPILIALFLLLNLRSELVQVPISRERLNAKRLRLGRRPLLAHIEVSSAVLAVEPRRDSHTVPAASRTAPRLHRVRGHIVRRGDAVFWRRPHWRGHVRLGSIQSRTVTLRSS